MKIDGLTSRTFLTSTWPTPRFPTLLRKFPLRMGFERSRWKLLTNTRTALPRPLGPSRLGLYSYWELVYSTLQTIQMDYSPGTMRSSAIVRMALTTTMTTLWTRTIRAAGPTASTTKRASKTPHNPAEWLKAMSGPP